MPENKKPEAASVPNGKHVVCAACGSIGVVDAKALADVKPDKLGRGHEDTEQRTVKCPGCGSALYRTINGRFVANLL